jgi:hypothetical protein
MDYDELVTLDWSMEPSLQVQPGFASLSNAFDYDEPVSSVRVQPTPTPKEAVAPVPCPPVAAHKTVRKGEHELRSTATPAQRISTRECSRWTPGPRISGSKWDDIQSLSESSTLPGDSSDAATTTPTHNTCDAGPTLPAPDTSSFSKRRRLFAKEEEEYLFDEALLQDLNGTTAARSKLMSSDERSLMLHKRRLRNRASASRSREKQRSAIQCLSNQVDSLTSAIHDLRRNSIAQQAEIQILREQNNILRATAFVRSSFLRTS